MKTILNGSGPAHGNGSIFPQPAKKPAKTPPPIDRTAFKENEIKFQNSEKVEVRGTLVRMNRHTVIFELYNPGDIPRLSEVFEGFKIILNERIIYSGRSVLSVIMDAGTKVICEATLNEDYWTLQNDEGVINGFKNFLQSWQKLYKVSSEFKVIIADMQTFLHDLRLWSEQVESEIQMLPEAERLNQERDIAQQIGPMIVPAIHNLFERFEEISDRVDKDHLAAHQAFGKRLVQPFLLTSPFVNRTFNKPLGYAGDYEMVNMMFRDPFQGDSLFAKMVNVYALQLPPIVAHRNRIDYLIKKIENESLRTSACGSKVKVFNIGCGPAQEVQRFLVESKLVEHADFTLADFNEETLTNTSRILNDLKTRHGRRTPLQFVKKPVQQLLRSAGRNDIRSQYDLVYCAGLFDYLSDQVCRQLMEVFYTMLLPGGLMIVTNVDDHAAQNQMECFLEWHLVHRDEKKMQTLIPEKTTSDYVAIKRDSTGVNVFVEVRKPEDEN